MERTPGQKYLDRLREDNMTLVKDQELFEMALALIDADDQQREKVAEVLGTPAHIEPIAVRKKAKR